MKNLLLILLLVLPYNIVNAGEVQNKFISCKGALTKVNDTTLLVNCDDGRIYGISSGKYPITFTELK